jgi:hypothetical protein
MTERSGDTAFGADSLWDTDKRRFTGLKSDPSNPQNPENLRPHLKLPTESAVSLTIAKFGLALMGRL